MSETNQKKQDLMNQLNDKSREISKLNFEIKRIETEEELPKIKEKLEGTYYKTKNGRGGGEEWDLYIHIDKIKSIYEATGYRFEEKPDGHYVDPRPLAIFGNIIHGWKQINKLEFDEAFVEMLDKINSLNK